MKYLLIILFTITLQAQEVSFRVDLRNLIIGSDVNDPALNFKVGISDYYNGTYLLLGMEFESFAEIGYQQWTFFKFDYDFQINRFSILPGFGLSQIYHKTSYSNNALSYEFNLEFRYKIGEFYLSLQFNRERATDILQDWRNSIYYGLVYQFN